MIEQTTKQKLVQIARQYFTDHGYYGTSIKNITEKMPMSKASFYHYFNSKEDAGLQVVKDSIDYCEQHIFNKLSSELTIEDSFAKAVQKYFEHGSDARCMLLFYVLCGTTETPRLKLAIEDYFKRWLEVLTHACQRYGYTITAAKEAASTLLCHLYGYLNQYIQSSHQANHFDIKRVLEKFDKAIISAET